MAALFAAAAGELKRGVQKVQNAVAPVVGDVTRTVAEGRRKVTSDVSTLKSQITKVGATVVKEVRQDAAIVVEDVAAAMQRLGSRMRPTDDKDGADDQNTPARREVFIGEGAARVSVDVLSQPRGTYEPRPAPLDADDGACTICFEHLADTTTFPCAHLRLCYNCALQLAKAECPSCRERIQAIAFTYM